MFWSKIKTFVPWKQKTEKPVGWAVGFQVSRRDAWTLRLEGGWTPREAHVEPSGSSCGSRPLVSCRYRVSLVGQFGELGGPEHPYLQL